MSLMTDIDITKAIGRDIVIEPFSPESMTPTGYDFCVGEYVFCLEHGLLEPNDGAYHIAPKSTVQILTRESLWVSGRIGGTFHSKVSLVSQGLSHISTRLDPGWYTLPTNGKVTVDSPFRRTLSESRIGTTK